MTRVFTMWSHGVLSERPREDFFAYDTAAGAFAIADGVGLWEGIEYEGKYPRTSGSAKISRTFCRAFVRYAAHHPRSGVRTSFMAANIAAGKENRGRSKYDVFREHRGLFAATAAMASIKDHTLEWAHICDAGVAVLGEDGKIKLREDACKNRFPWPNDVRTYGSSTLTLFFRTIVRNAIDRKGRRIGYGVVTGEPEAAHYLESGKYKLVPGDTVLLYTDGFTPYVGLGAFRKQLARLTAGRDLQNAIARMVARKSALVLRSLRKHPVDQRASVEVIEAKARKILGGRFREIQWVKEKSIIVIKP